MKYWGMAALLLFGSVQSAGAEDVVIAADLWCPYNCAPGSDQPGYMVEIAAKAFEGAGHRLVYKTMPWARALAEAEAGRIAGVFGASPEEAGTLIYPKQPLARSRNVLAVPVGSPFVWSSVKGLEGMALGVIQDYSYGATLDAYIKANAKDASRIQSLSGDAPLLGNLRKLMAGRIGATVDDANVLAYTLKAESLGGTIRLVDMSDTPSPLFIGLSPKLGKASDYAALLDKTVASLRASGDLAALLARYGVKDWDKSGS